MKKCLLVVLFIGLLVQLKAQNAIWSEDFSNGLKDWTVTSTECGTFTDDIIGEWTLTRAIVNGQELSGATGYFSVGTNDAYIAKFNSGSTELYVQGKYTLNGGTFVSNLNGESLNLMDQTVKTENNDTITVYFAALNTSQSDYDNLQFTMGINNPTFTINTTTLEISSGGNTFTYQRTSECGALWYWDQIGWYGNGALIFPTATALSNTAANGAAVINTDFYITGGIFENLPDQPYPVYQSELISPIIDLSGVTSGVQLSFYQTVRILNEGDDAPTNIAGTGLVTSIFYSTDGGSTWEGPIDANEGLPINDQTEEGLDTVPLPISVLGSDQFRIKFTWSGDFYYWVLDDITISNRLAFDMQVNENFLAKYPNIFTPSSQIDGASFLADIQNNGASTAEDVALNLSIRNDQTGAEVYNSTINYGSVTPDSLAENSVFPDRLEAEALEADLATTPSGIASYTGTYSVSHAEADGNSENDISTFQFYILDTLFTRCDLIEGCNIRGITFPADNSITFGNTYYTPNGEGNFASSMAFAIANPDELINRTVSLLLYEWDGDLNDDFLATTEEYGAGPIGFNTYIFDGTEVGELIELPLFSFSDPTMPPALQNDKHYIIMVQYFTDDDQQIFFLTTNDVNYQATTFVSDSIGEPRYMSMLGLGQELPLEFISINEFTSNASTTPIVHLHVSSADDPTPVENLLPDDNLIELYPNPASDLAQLNIELTETSEKVRVEIFDQMGRATWGQEYESVRQNRLDLDVSDVPAGIYLMKITTDFGSRALKLIKE